MAFGLLILLAPSIDLMAIATIAQSIGSLASIFQRDVPRLSGSFPNHLILMLNFLVVSQARVFLHQLIEVLFYVSCVPPLAPDELVTLSSEFHFA